MGSYCAFNLVTLKKQKQKQTKSNKPFSINAFLVLLNSLIVWIYYHLTNSPDVACRGCSQLLIL